MVDSVHTSSTSAHTARANDVVLRQNDAFRLVFRPLLLDNPHDAKASVKGTFVFQRKALTGSWGDYKTLDATKLRADEWMKLELSSAEVLALFKALTELYALVGEHGVPRGEVDFVRVRDEAFAKLLTSEGELRASLDKQTMEAVRGLVRGLANWLTEQDPAEMADALKSLDPQTLGNFDAVIGAARLREFLDTFEANRQNADERFWQMLLESTTGFSLRCMPSRS